MSIDVVVLGSANMDLVATAPTLPKPGETVLGHGFATVPGGKGLNQAVAAARAGARTAFIGAVGDDAFGAQLREALTADGVDVSGLREAPGASGVALIAVDDAGENSIVVAPGANATVDALTAADLGGLSGARVLLCQLEVPEPAIVAAGKATGDTTLMILNAAPARPLSAELLATVGLLVVNEVEAAMLSGWDADPLTALLRVVPRVVVTLGGAGSRYADAEGARLDVPAPKVPVVDTTGAGDCFTGALATAIAEGRPMEEALRWATAAGALAVQKTGATTSLPHRADIDQLYEVTYR
ncbi:ribokinase [Actinorhabdospora filicis]|uniref:Ribokinase n=1 Tax=Actinorhabdospora filicis TaxID=1785913 RepID=A0A9W6SQ62_9ACTN|nr:ribokinase [Actinorhabdospora filicis]GLZ80206.1 ribokinase [Actinorhabdospora filicis]